MLLLESHQFWGVHRAGCSRPTGPSAMHGRADSLVLLCLELPPHIYWHVSMETTGLGRDREIEAGERIPENMWSAVCGDVVLIL